jgi:acyl-CoA reductase-like NAD-dependent aldehyde dehydrogenase
MSALNDRNHPPIKHPDRFFIDGEWVKPSSPTTIDVIAPATGELYQRVAEAQKADVDRAVAAAREAFDRGPWPRMSHVERASFLMAIATALDARLDDISSVWPNEMGILHSMARAFAPRAGTFYRDYAQLATTFDFEKEAPTTAGAKVGLLRYEAVGVVGIIIPWNGPIMSIAVKLAPALLAGCTAVIKASPEAPNLALLMGEVAETVGLPKGVVNVVTADRAVSEELVKNPGVDKISFTGSTAAGMRIASLLGGRMARYTMELGGKSAAIVLDDYDVAEAARVIATNVVRMTGQVCAALTRVVVTKKRHDDLLDALVAASQAIRVGNPFDEQSQMGPLASSRQRDRVERYIAQGRTEGLLLAAGGNRPKHLDRGYYIEPTVFGNVPNQSIVAQEEIFGPVVAVIPAADEADAVAIANESVYGLNSAVFTNSVERAYAVARQIRAGTVGHNGATADFGIAFGGFKQSGVGREGGTEGLRPYLEPKTILLNSSRHA